MEYGGGEASLAVSSGGGHHYIDFDLAVDAASSQPGTNLGYIKFYDPAGIEITRVYVADQEFKVLTGGGVIVSIMTNPGNRVWRHIRLGITLSTGKLDVWVDGIQKIQSATTYNPASSIAQVTIGEWQRNSGFTKAWMYVDNLVCTEDSTSLPAVRVLSPFGGWERRQVCHPFVIRDGAGYRMYYSASGGPECNDSAWSQWMTGMVTSTDSFTWARRTDLCEPVLYACKFMEGDLLDPDEIASVFDSIFVIGPCVIKDGSTYKMWYTGWAGETQPIGGGLENRINFRIGYATSADGSEWTKFQGSAGAGSVLGLGQAGGLDSKGVGQPYVIKDGATYRMWYEGFDGTTWRIFYTTSPDGTNWTKHGVALEPGASGSPDALGVRNPVVIFRNGSYELWYQGRSASAPNYHVMRATSPDGLTWSRVPGEVKMSPDDALDGDEQIHVDSILVQPDGSVWVFFAKENTTAETLIYGTVYEKVFHIYRQVMNP